VPKPAVLIGRKELNELSAYYHRVDVEGCPGREVVATVQEFAPRDSGKHYHPAQSLSYVLEGSETWELEGKPKVTLKPGDFLYDEARQVHQTGNTAPLKLLIVRILEKGKPATDWPRIALARAQYKGSTRASLTAQTNGQNPFRFRRPNRAGPCRALTPIPFGQSRAFCKLSDRRP
jgi:quercetin dioxygenase-like cupin family protein